MLQGKHILIGISGGIAAYKIPLLIRLFKKEGAEVKTVVTHNALEFVTRVTLETLTDNDVYDDVFAPHKEHSTQHVSLHDWADIMLVAPATANIIAKMANGIADDALSTTFLAMHKPVLVAPAMNDKMYSHPAVRQNIERLQTFPNVSIIDCETGELACHSVGKGRMAEPDSIFAHALYLLIEPTLSGKRVLITAGPTQEKIDPVRFISNYSTGKMAYALAATARRRGAEVTIVSGPVSHEVKKQAQDCNIVDVITAAEMYESTIAMQPTADIIILCAAVADFRVANYCEQKIKREGDSLTLTLQPTQDIAAAVGKQKRQGQVLVGFALETNNELEHALGKLSKKNLDMIVLNSLQDNGAGFGYDTNKVEIIKANGESVTTALESKQHIAELIVNEIEKIGRQ